MTKRTTKPKARLSDTPIEQWHAWFAAKTGLLVMAARSQVSTPTIAKLRRKLGYKHWPRGGASKRIYTKKDALAIAKHKRGGKTLKMAAKLAGYGYCAAKTISMRYRDILPPSRTLREVNCW